MVRSAEHVCRAFAPIPVIAIILISVLAALVVPDSASAAAPSYVDGEVLLKFRASASQSDKQAILSDLGATRLQRFRRTKTERHRVSRSVSDAVARYRHHPAVEFIEPNYILHADVVPNDPLFAQQWALHNTGQDGGTPGADIDAAAAWELETGSNQVVVGVIDTGVDYTHPDLAANIFVNPGEVAGNGIDDDGNGFVDDVRGWDFLNQDNDPIDDNGHGTHVAGIIGAAGNNGSGTSGVAWNVRILPLKFLSASGSGPTSAAVDCVEYATSMGVFLTNNSWGGGAFSEALRLAIAEAEEQGILFVAAAGNNAMNTDLFPHYPSTYDLANIISVGSTTRFDQLSDFSNFGVQTVDLAAPGSSILSTIPGANHAAFSGTSMAAPHVAGALALLRSRFPFMPAASAKILVMNSADRLTALAGLVQSGGRLNAHRMLEGIDSLPPDPVVDLAVGTASFDRVQLTFTATGDDGSLGTAAHYDVRYDFGPIDESTFGLAIPAPGLPAPRAAGTPEQVTVTGLYGYTQYWFALRVVDEYGNASLISNVVAVETTGPPDIAVSPSSLEESLLTGGTASASILVQNLGEGTLDIAVETETTVDPVTAHQALTLAKGENDPRPGFGALGSGGPDQFGYRWSDSDSPGGPSFEWQDITATGTLLPIFGDDIISDAVPIGFAFPFYGETYSQVFVCSNGFLTFSPGSSPQYVNQPLPSGGAPLNLIAAFWDDLIVGVSSSVYWKAESSRFIVQWTNLTHFSAPGLYTFQAILDRNGVIRCQYLAMSGLTSSATVGIQNATGIDGLTAAFNTAYAHDGLAVRFAAAPPWLSAAPATASIPSGGSASILATLSAAGLYGGTYDARLRFTSNDPDGSPLFVPVRLHVTGAPDIAFDPVSVSFGSVFVGGEATRILHVINAGTDSLHVTALSASPSDFTVVNASSFSLPPESSREVAVRFAPIAPGPTAGALTVLSNDPDEGAAMVALSGEGLVPPDIAVAPGALHESLLTGGVASRNVTVANEGGSDLEWSIRAGSSAALLRRYTLAPPPSAAAAPDGAAAGIPGAARADSLGADLADLTDVRILFDAAHGSGGPVFWTGIIADLTARGAEVVVSSQPITPAALQGFDVVWTVDSYIPWQAAERAALREWILGGGSLLLEGDNFETVPVFNGILESLGMPVTYVPIPGAGGLTSRIYPHPATRDVQSILLNGNIAFLTTPIPPAQILVEDVQGVPNTAAAGLGAGRILMMADEVFSDFHAVEGDNQLFANQAFDWLAGIRWLSVLPAAGTTPAGSSSPVQVRFDATGLGTGTYSGNLLVQSNDPDEPEAGVDVTLDVTGAPDVRVTPLSIDFDSLFVGESRTDTVRVSNVGTEDLHVASVSLVHADFSTDPSPFTVPPGGVRFLPVAFAPQAPGTPAATLTIACDDPDRPNISVSLSGIGLPPPDVVLEPATFHEALNTGDTVTRNLTVSNIGSSPLAYSIRIEEGPQGPGAGSSGPGALPASSESWSVIRDRARADTMRTVEPPLETGLTLPVVVTDPPGDGNPDVRVLRGSGRGGFVEIELETASPIVPFNFGGFVSLDIDQDRTTGRRPSFSNPLQDIGAEYEFLLFSLPSGYVDLFDARTGAYRGSFPAVVQGPILRFAAPLAALGGDDGRMDVTGVIGTSSGPTDWFPDQGHGTIGSWLSVQPRAGIVAPSGSTPVAVTFDARDLDGGVHEADIVVGTNDPDERETRLSARLDVTGIPLIDVQPSALRFDSLYVGLTETQALRIGNIGSAALHVVSISIDAAEFSADAATLTILPRASRLVTVTFAPQAPGPKSASLSLVHDAPGSPTVVPLSGVSVAPPVLTLSPDSIVTAVETGGSETQSLHVGNAGGSDLHFAIAGAQDAAAVVLHEALELPRGTPDPRVGEPVTLGAGGPDRFGYRWIDSDQPGGPVFDWVEISGIGTRIPMSRLDDNTGPFPIGFEFPFYGNRFTHFNACTHGWVSFTSRAVQWTNQPLPSLGAPENLLAIFWEDQNFSGVERAYYHFDGTRLIIQYDGVPATGGGGPYTYQAILYPNGSIVYQYLQMSPPTGGATVGIQNGLRDDGLGVVFNAPYVRDGLAIRFSPAPQWLSVVPASASLPAGGSLDVLVTTDAGTLFPGTYRGRLEVTSNDPARRLAAVPVSMRVIGVPDLAVSPASLAFGTVFVGQRLDVSFRITNMGTDRLEVSGIAAGLAEFAPEATTLSLAPLQSRELWLRFTPSAARDYGTTLEIVSNDPDSPLQIPITAAALLPPVAGLVPAQLTAAAAPGGSKEKRLRICNTGGSDLQWSAMPQASAGSAAPSAGLALAKGEADPRPGVLGSGGPDVAGHRWVDSDEPGGPQFAWTDIDTTGTVVGFSANADDQNLGPFPIGFAFPFYGQTHTQFRVCTNGWISFTSSSIAYTNQMLPSSGAPLNLVAALWDDLILAASVSSRVLYWSDGTRLIVQYENLLPYGVPSATTYNFQIELSASGEIRFRYLTIGSVAASATVGIQNGEASDGLPIAFNAPYLHEQLEVRITAVPPWLAVSPMSGVVPAGACGEIDVTFDGSYLEEGDYESSIAIVTNDPATPTALAPCLFHVGLTEAASADLDPNTLNLDSRGRWVMGRVELPVTLDPADVVLSSVRFLGSVPADQDSLSLGDYDQNGIPDLEFRFPRAACEALLPEGAAVPIELTGEVEDQTIFIARDTIRVIRPRLDTPNGGEVWLTGSQVDIAWSNPQGWNVEHAAISYSIDAGSSWMLVADPVPGTSYRWTVPAHTSARVLVRVHVYDRDGVLGYDTSDGVLGIFESMTAVEEAQTLPSVTALHPSAPNPFHRATTLRFDMPAAGQARLRIFGPGGRLVRTLREGALPAGRHRVEWDGRNDQGAQVAAGVYFYRLEVAGSKPYEKSRRMILLR